MGWLNLVEVPCVLLRATGFPHRDVSVRDRPVSCIGKGPWVLQTPAGWLLGSLWIGAECGGSDFQEQEHLDICKPD